MRDQAKDVAKSAKPNVLFLFADQWIHDWLGFRGHRWARTPNLDRLADGATCFTHAFCATPLCSPSRGTALTALWPQQSGVLDNLRSLGNSRQPPLAREQRTWIEAACEAGYRVGYFGKWHLGTDGPMTRGALGPAGGMEPSTDLPTHDPHADEEGRLLKPLPAEDPRTGYRPPFHAHFPGTPEETQSGRIATQAVDFLAGCTTEQPWFLTASFYGPHFPHLVPSPWWEQFRPEEVQLPSNLDESFEGKPWYQAKAWWDCQATDHFSPADWKKTIAAYLGMLALVDGQIGRIMAEAQARSAGRPLYVVFAADHGEMLGAHGRFDKGPYFYDEVWRVPLILREPADGEWLAPGRQSLPPKARLNDAFVNLLDLGATLFALTGATPPATGRDLRTALGAERNDDRWPRVAYGVYNYYNGHAFAVRAVRNDRWKYVYHPQAVDELYDLQTDPGERQNLAAAPAAQLVRQALRGQLFEWMRQQGDALARLNQEQLPPAGAFRDLCWELTPGRSSYSAGCRSIT